MFRFQEDHLFQYLRQRQTKPTDQPMKSDSQAQKASLQKRELELQLLIRQMKLDQLHNSRVYKNLEQELSDVKAQLSAKAL